MHTVMLSLRYEMVVAISSNLLLVILGMGDRQTKLATRLKLRFSPIRVTSQFEGPTARSA